MDAVTNANDFDLRGETLPELSEERLAEATMEAKREGIVKSSHIDRAYIDNDRIWIDGKYFDSAMIKFSHAISHS